MLKIFFIVLLLLPVVSFSQDAADSTGSDLSAAQAKQVLDHHNKVRSEVHLTSLTWSADLASFAQEWADSLVSTGACKLRHRQNNEYGENIYMNSSSSSFNPVSASQAWYGEKQKYTYSKIGEAGSAHSMHYTQMIWKDTKEVGMGMATCANGGVIVVANYSPAGNYTGNYPY